MLEKAHLQLTEVLVITLADLASTCPLIKRASEPLPEVDIIACSYQNVDVECLLPLFFMYHSCLNTLWNLRHR